MSKAALITGSGARIGKAIALALAEAGYDVAVHYNCSEREARATAGEIRAKGVKCEVFKYDLSNIKDTRALVEDVFRYFPYCSLLINNASVFENTGFMETTEETFDRDFSINFKAPFFLAQEFSRQESAKLIVNILDTRVTKIETDNFVYNLSKRALRDFTLMAAKALGPKIRVNGICPGPTLPPRGKGMEYLKRISENTPLGVPGNPDFVIAGLKYIIENTYLTGECLFIDGGQHLG
jgi:pteridine reductase